MLLEHLKNSLNTSGKPTKFKRTYELLPDGRHNVKWIGSKGNKSQSIYTEYDPDGNRIKCFVCGIHCLTEVVKYQRKNGDHKKRHTCTRKCQNVLTGATSWNPQYIERDDEGWFYDNYTGYIIRRYRPILGKPRIKEFYHRYVMEQHLGRKLLSIEHIHHIDMDKLNNDISNLWLCNHIDHLNSHHSTKILIKPLIEKGIIGFDNTKGKYYLERKDYA
tara:strand:- start:63 stop:716 length:654 start_codon:yes stop_codon:yes gene_type:complete